jgi:hypothetical protein
VSLAMSYVVRVEKTDLIEVFGIGSIRLRRPV